MILPILLIINLYRQVEFSFFSQETILLSGASKPDFRGFNYLIERISSFPGLTRSLDTLDNVYKACTNFGHSTADIGSIVDVFNVVVNFFLCVYYVFSVPVMVVVDIVTDVWWVLSLFMTI